MVNDAETPAIRPAFTSTLPAFNGRSTDARGLGVAATVKPPEIVRLPWPDTLQISFTPSNFRSSTSAGITYPESILPVASPKAGSPEPRGNAFQYSIATP